MRTKIIYYAGSAMYLFSSWRNLFSTHKTTRVHLLYVYTSIAVVEYIIYKLRRRRYALSKYHPWKQNATANVLTHAIAPNTFSLQAAHDVEIVTSYQIYYGNMDSGLLFGHSSSYSIWSGHPDGRRTVMYGKYTHLFLILHILYLYILLYIRSAS